MKGKGLELNIFAVLALSECVFGAFSVYDDIFASPHFSVEYSRDYLSSSKAKNLMLEDSESYEYVRMPTNDYLCFFPDAAMAVDSNPTADQENATQKMLMKQQQELKIVETLNTSLEMLGDMNTCVFHTMGYFTYQFCYNRDLLQYHADHAKRLQGIYAPEMNTEVFVLGKYPRLPEPDGTNNEEDFSKQLVISSSIKTEGKSKYLTQTIKNGSVCSLTGEKRSTEVRYLCDPAYKDAAIIWIKEIRTCNYQIAINEPKLCSQEVFAPKREELPMKVTCQPISIETDDNMNTTAVTEQNSNIHDESNKLEIPRITKQKQNTSDVKNALIPTGIKYPLDLFKLEALGNGIFLGTPRDNYYRGIHDTTMILKPSVFIIQSDPVNIGTLEHLAADAFIMAIGHELFRFQDSNYQVINRQFDITYLTEILDKDGNLLGTVLLVTDEGKIVVSMLEDDYEDLEKDILRKHLDINGFPEYLYYPINIVKVEKQIPVKKKNKSKKSQAKQEEINELDEVEQNEKDEAVDSTNEIDIDDTERMFIDQAVFHDEL